MLKSCDKGDLVSSNIVTTPYSHKATLTKLFGNKEKLTKLHKPLIMPQENKVYTVILLQKGNDVA
jgi:hypothetical protein